MFTKQSSSLLVKSCIFIRQSIINSKILAPSSNIFVKGYCTGTGLKRKEPAPVRLGFIPDEWLSAFYNKTGVSGLGTLAFTVSTFLVSKEYYVLEHEYYSGLSVALMCVIALKKLGPMASEYLDKEIDEYEQSWNQARNNDKEILDNQIKHEVKEQWSQDGQLMIIEAKRENVALQLEAVYRQRLMEVYNETRERLNYCVTREEIEKSAAKRYMVDWVIESVRAAVTKEIEDQSLDKCFNELAELAKYYDSKKSAYPTPSISGPELPHKR